MSHTPARGEFGLNDKIVSQPNQPAEPVNDDAGNILIKYSTIDTGSITVMHE